MDNQGGEGNIYLNGLNSRNNLPFHQLPLTTKHQTTPTFPNIERILEIDPNSNLDLSQELNEPIQGELDEVSTRRKGKWSTQEDRFSLFIFLHIYFTPSVPTYLSCLTFCDQIDQTLTGNSQLFRHDLENRKITF